MRQVVQVTGLLRFAEDELIDRPGVDRAGDVKHLLAEVVAKLPPEFERPPEKGHV